MKHTFNIKMRLAFWILLGTFGLVCVPPMAYSQSHCQSYWTAAYKCSQGCGSCPSSGRPSSSGGGYTDPSGGFVGKIWDGIFSPGPSAAEKADQQGRAANERGVQAYKNGDWATAIELFQQALRNDPGDPTYTQNLVNAQNNLANQQARERVEREALDRQRANQIAANNMQQSIQNFAQTLNAAPVSGGLDFDGRILGSAPGGGTSGGLDFTASIALPSQARPAPVLPSNDPMVVDARVPSGLPKSLDDAIPHSPSGDRVRKGFQAIQDGDWKVALAWFQDARNKEPGNPGLGRLVDLAEFTLAYRTRAPAVEKNSAPVQSTQSPNQNSIPSSKDGAAIKPGAVEPGDTTMARAVAGQMAAKERADAARKQYVKKYGDGDVVGRASAVSRASRGEGYTDEELKVQLQKSLLEYRKNYRKNHPNGPADRFIPPSTEEISLGGKG
ncbi:MAG: tetratricopeptide repeat protein [Polaromonas sp.]|nr:tetratricopeptide repeat protein [Polaromonas sp.]MDP3753139.1 tetratricopeptide repeat protein [Polaromonas sp.]